MKTRYALLSDGPALLDLFHEYYKEWPNPDTPWEEEATQSSVFNGVMDNNIVITEHAGEIVGVAVVESVSPYWTHSMILECRILYVTKPYRGKSVAKRLMKELDKIGYERGCVAVHLGTTSGIETERTAKFYERCGYVQLGYEYRKVLK